MPEESATGTGHAWVWFRRWVAEGWRRWPGWWLAAAALALCGAGVSVLLPLGPWLGVTPHGRTLLWMGSLLVARGVLGFLQDWTAEAVGERAMNQLGERLCRGFAAAPFEVRARYDLSGFLLLFSQTGPRLEMLLRELPRSLFGALPLLATLAAVGLWRRPGLTVVLLATGLVALPVFWWQGRQRARRGQQVIALNARHQRRLRELAASIHTLWGLMAPSALGRALATQQQYFHARSANHQRGVWLVYAGEGLGGLLLLAAHAKGVQGVGLSALLAGLLGFHVAFSALRQLLRLPLALRELGPQMAALAVLYSQPQETPAPWPGAVTALSLEEGGYVYGAGLGREVTGLSGCSVLVQPGRLVVVTGPNGAGKSTLLRLLSARLWPTQGRLRVNGAAVATHQRRSLAQNLIYLPQDAVLPEGAVGDLLEDIGEGRGLLLARKLGVMALLKRAASPDQPELSRGEAQKILLCHVLAMPADGYFLDEWDTALDNASRQAVLQELRTLARTKIVVTATHDEGLIGPDDVRVAMEKR